MTELMQQYRREKIAKETSSASGSEFKSRLRTMSGVPDLCIDKSVVNVTDIVTASYRIRDGILKTPCEVSQCGYCMSEKLTVY
jgi:hypothetical protein